MNEYRVKVSVRNNLILQALEEAGYSGHGALAQFCRDNDMDSSQLSSLVAFRVAPITADGEFSKLAKDLMEALGAAPTDLWTAEQMTMRLDRNSAERAVSKEVVRDLLDWRNERLEAPSPEASLQHKETADVVRGVLSRLRGNERDVLAMRFGIGDKPEMTLDEVAELFGVTRERIRQIELQALRKLRHPKNAAAFEKAGLAE